MPILTISLKAKELAGHNTITLNEPLNVHHFKLLHIHHNISSKKFTDRSGVLNPAQNSKAQRLFYISFDFMNIGDVNYNQIIKDTRGGQQAKSLSLINLGLTTHSTDGTIQSRDLYKQLVHNDKQIPRDLKYQLFFKDFDGEIQDIKEADLKVSSPEISFIDFVFEYDLQ